MATKIDISTEMVERKFQPEREGYEYWFKHKKVSGSGNIVVLLICGLIILAPLLWLCHFANMTYENNKLRRKIYKEYGIEPWKLV